jgi:WD40 repeat protein
MLSRKENVFAYVSLDGKYIGHLGPVYRLATNSDGFYSAGSDGMLVHWSFENSKIGAAILKAPIAVFSLAATPNDVFVGLNDGRIVSKHGVNVKYHTGPVFGMNVCDDILFSVGFKGELCAFNLTSKYLCDRKQFTRENLRCIISHPNLPLLVIAGSDNIIRILDRKLLREIHAINAHQSTVFALEFSSDGKLLYSAGRDAHIKVFDFDTFKLLFDIPAHFFAVNDIKLIFNDKYLASASMDKTIRIWRAEDMKLIKVVDNARNSGHTSSVNSLLWSETYETLISASDDATILAWKIQPLV